MFEEINAWLNGGKEYNAGVTLYEKFGASASQKRILRLGGPTKKNVDIVEYELRRIIKGQRPCPVRPVIWKNNTPAPVKNIIPVTARPKPQDAGQKTSRRPNTVEVDKLNERKITLLKIRDNLHATLAMVGMETRRGNAFEILRISDEIDEIYTRLDHYEKHGALPVIFEKPVQKAITEMDKSTLFKRQMTLRTYVSRYERLILQTKKLETLEKKREKLNKYKLELQNVEECLKK